MTICVICKKEIKHYTFFYNLSNKLSICTKCFSSFPVVHKKIKFHEVEVYSIYAYRQPINALLMDLKMKGDIALSMVFLSPFKNYIEFMFKDYIILPVPSTKASDKKRGFNHVVEISKALNLEVKEVFYKSKDYKQTNQKFGNRKDISKVIKLKVNLDKKKKYLLLDDVMTSGNTIKTCIDLLRKQDIKNIKVLVVSDNYHK